MAKTKRSTPPLFELLEGNRLRRGDLGPPPDLRVVHPEPESEEASSQRGARFALAGEHSATNGRHAVAQFLGDRLHLSLTPFTAAVGVFLIAVVVLGAIYLGQQRGEKAARRAIIEAGIAGAPADADTVEAARQQQPAAHLVESLLANDAKPNPSPKTAERAQPKNTPAPALSVTSETSISPQHGWVRDFTYIMTQEFAAGRMEDARRAQDFLASRGFPAEIVKLDSGALQLITLEGYNHKDADQKKKADALLKKQRAAGTEYFATGGGYKLEGYFKTLKKDQW